jgi:hypothetical protein
MSGTEKRTKIISYIHGSNVELSVPCHAIMKVQSALQSMYCNVDLFSITLWNEPTVCCKRYETAVYLVTSSSTAPHTHNPAVHQPAFRYHPTPGEPHQYTSAHRNRYVITFAYDKRTHPGHITITRYAPTHPQRYTIKQTRH